MAPKSGQDVGACPEQTFGQTGYVLYSAVPWSETASATVVLAAAVLAAAVLVRTALVFFVPGKTARGAGGRDMPPAPPALSFFNNRLRLSVRAALPLHR